MHFNINSRSNIIYKELLIDISNDEEYGSELLSLAYLGETWLDDLNLKAIKWEDCTKLIWESSEDCGDHRRYIFY